MADPSPDPGGGEDTGVGLGRGSTPGTPRWVKAYWIVAIAIVLLLVILLLTGGNHGPGRHRSGGDTGRRPERGWTILASAEIDAGRGTGGLAYG